MDWFFYLVSVIGSEYFFLGVAAVLLWCVNKRFGYKFLNVYFVGQIFVGLVKTIVKRPRPFDANAEIVSVIGKTEGYSFPSGHSQSITNISTQVALFSREKTGNKAFLPFALVGGFVSLLVMFSRMYLGQHYLSDVVCGAAVGVLAAILLSQVFELLENKEERLVFFVLPLSVIGAVVLFAVGENVGGAMKLFGVWGAACLGYFLEKKYVHYGVKSGSILRQIIKVALGLIVLLAALEGMGLAVDRVPIRLGLIVEFARYFFVGICATFAAPAIFKKLGL